MEMFDMDGNGTIDSYEFTCALSLMSHATLDEKAELIFNLYDFDRSQSISKDELTVLMANSMASLISMQGGNRSAPTVNEIEVKTNQLFAKADTDKNNQISLKEFKNYIKKDQEILKILMQFGVAQSDDLGTDFGNSDVPAIDEDLEGEINPKGL